LAAQAVLAQAELAAAAVQPLMAALQAAAATLEPMAELLVVAQLQVETHLAELAELAQAAQAASLLMSELTDKAATVVETTPLAAQAQAAQVELAEAVA
jgi:hypothetical protein